MAVNGESPEEVIRFYEESVPDLRARIVANQIHTRILEEVGRRHGIRVIDAARENIRRGAKGRGPGIDPGLKGGAPMEGRGRPPMVPRGEGRGMRRFK